MAKFKIVYGVRTGMPDTIKHQVIYAKDIEEAESICRKLVYSLFSLYTGNYGLREVVQIMREEEVDELRAEQIFKEERERRVIYEAEEYEE